MKVVLLSDVKNLGKAGSVIEAKDGFAKNYLIAKGLAAVAGSSRANVISKKIQNEAKQQEQELNLIKNKLEKLKNNPIILQVKVGPNGKLFGAITPNDIAKELVKYGVNLNSKQIETSNIKTVGIHEVDINLEKSVTMKLSIKVEGRE